MKIYITIIKRETNTRLYNWLLNSFISSVQIFLFLSFYKILHKQYTINIKFLVGECISLGYYKHIFGFIKMFYSLNVKKKAF